MEAREGLIVGGLALALAILTVFGGSLFGSSVDFGFGLLIATTILSLLIRIRTDVDFAKLVLMLIFLVWLAPFFIILFTFTFFGSATAATNAALSYLNLTTGSLLTFGVYNMIWTAVLAFPTEIKEAIQKSL